MARFITYDMKEKDKLCELGKALSSPERVAILQLLYNNSLIIGEIAKTLKLPVSSTVFHLKILEQAGLITMEAQPVTRGNTKLCTGKADYINIELVGHCSEADEIFSAEMPIGAYSSCRVTPTCGLCTADGQIGIKDAEYSFYYPERMYAGILWSSSGYVEYKFANGVPKNRTSKQISISMEMCSEAPKHCDDWKSDITLWINDVECATWTSPGDFGNRRGRLNPSWWLNDDTQYGMQVVWKINREGSYVNGEKVSNVTVEQLNLPKHSFIGVRVGNKPDARYVGGFNLFGKTFGDYEQDIILTVEY